MEGSQPDREDEKGNKFTPAISPEELADPDDTPNTEQVRREPYEIMIPLPKSYSSSFGGEVVVSEVHAFPATPEDIPDGEVPIIYAHGYGLGKEQPVLREITRITGRRALSTHFTGERAAEKGFRIGNTASGGELHLEEVPDAQAVAKRIREGNINTVIPDEWVAAGRSLLDVLRIRGENLVDAIGQSRDIGPILMAALEDPSAFRNIVMAYPSGIGGPHMESPKVISDALVSARNKPTKEESFRPELGYRPNAILSLLKELRHPNPIARAAALKFSALAPVLHAIRQKEDAPGVVLVTGIDDKIFPWEKQLGSLLSSTDIDAVVFMPGGHGIKNRRPVLEEILQQFGKLEALKTQDRTVIPPLRDRVFLSDDTPSHIKDRILVFVDEMDRAAS